MPNINDDTPFTGELVPSVYHSLAEHQVTEQWQYRDAIRVMHGWAEVFLVEFKIQIPEIAIRLDWLRRDTNGHFQYEENGFGLKGELCLNLHHMYAQPFPEVLGTMLSGLLQISMKVPPGRRNYHGAEFRQKALELGIVVDSKGNVQLSPGGPLSAIIEQRADTFDPVKLPEIDPQKDPRKKRKSTNRRWTCGCTNVRVGVKEFQAQCLKCGKRFEPSAEQQPTSNPAVAVTS